MKTIILSGGRGYRLKEETDWKPKPMITIGDHPIIWHIMKIYAHYGFRDFILALGYKGDLIRDYFLSHKYHHYNFTLNTKTGTIKIHRSTANIADNFNITFVDTGQETLTAGRILKAAPYLKQDKHFMVTYGDGLSTVNINRLIAFHKHLGKLATITGVYPQTRWGLAVVNKHNLVTRFQEKPQLNQFVNGGFMVFKRQVLDQLREDEYLETSLTRLAQQQQLALFKHKSFWYAMDTYRDMEELNRLWQNNAPWKIWQ